MTIDNCYSKSMKYNSEPKNAWPLLKDRAHIYNWCAWSIFFYVMYIIYKVITSYGEN